MTLTGVRSLATETPFVDAVPILWNRVLNSAAAIAALAERLILVKDSERQSRSFLFALFSIILESPGRLLLGESQHQQQCRVARQNGPAEQQSQTELFAVRLKYLPASRQEVCSQAELSRP